MPKLSSVSQPGSTKQEPNSTLTKNGQDICLSKQLLHAISPVNTAQEKKLTNIWTGTSSETLLTKHHITDLVHSLCIYSGNLFFIQKNGRLSNTSKRKISLILSSLRQTVLYLNDMLMILLGQELTKFYGPGDQNQNGHKKQKKNYDPGRISQSASLKKSRQKKPMRNS